MTRLTVFGGAMVHMADGQLSGRAAQRHRIALLAVLACSVRPHRSRDQLMTLLWPDADGERGRRLLSDSIYRINEALGGDVIICAGEDVRLDRERLPSDVAELEEAADAGDWASVVRVHAGPLLDGFYLPRAAEFDRWMEAERDRYARVAARGLESLATDAHARGRVNESAEWWQQLAAMMPDDARVAMEVMRALDACGQRARAIRHAEVHAAILRETLGLEPDAGVQALARSLAARGATSPHVALMKSQQDVRPQADSRGVVTGIALAVLPFASLSDAAGDGSLARGLSREVAHALVCTAGLRVASHASVLACRKRRLDAQQTARRLHAEWIVEGSVWRAGSVVRIGVQLTAAASGYQVWSETFDGSAVSAHTLPAEIATSVAMSIAAGNVNPVEERRIGIA
ncbi:MAG: BTAD domain-containing putative transcriptional regulator [Gemmatimonadaceae bacterium]